MMYQFRFFNCSKCTTLVWDVNSGGGWGYREYMGTLILFTQFCHEHKTSVKKIKLILKSLKNGDKRILENNFCLRSFPMKEEKQLEQPAGTKRSHLCFLFLLRKGKLSFCMLGRKHNGKKSGPDTQQRHIHKDFLKSQLTVNWVHGQSFTGQFHFSTQQPMTQTSSFPLCSKEKASLESCDIPSPGSQNSVETQVQATQTPRHTLKTMSHSVYFMSKEVTLFFLKHVKWRTAKIVGHIAKFSCSQFRVYQTMLLEIENYVYKQSELFK